MREVKASNQLLDAVLQQADDERAAADEDDAHHPTTNGTEPESASSRSFNQPRAKRSPSFKFALAACLVLLVGIVGISLAMPVLSGSNTAFVGKGGASPFAVQAYGAMDDTLLPSGSQGALFFNCETETQRMVPVQADQYANEGFYSGCVFSVESSEKEITRIQANVSKGELYRVTSKVFSRESDPEFAREANGWKWYKIGQGDYLKKYDYVAGVPYYGTIHEGEENLGKDRNDPSRTSKVNLYQRLGPTIDTDVVSEPETDLCNYAFGLWTNEPFDMVAYDPDNPDNYYPDANINRALDTLDGAQLTVTVTFADGTSATQVIDLHAADFKANIITTADGINHVEELVPEIIEVPERTLDQIIEDRNNGFASIHTLYGLVNKTNEEPFPCGEASYPYLDTPLTQPRQLDPPPEPTNEQRAAASSQPPGPFIPRENLSEFGTSYDDGNGMATTFDSIEGRNTLPEGVELTDLHKYYEGSGGKFNPDTGTIETGFGYTIASDGTLSPGFSYVLLTKTITNTSNEELDAYVAHGIFITLKEDNEGYQSTYASTDEPLWRSGHEGEPWESHINFHMMAPGETREFSLLYVLPDDVLNSPNLAFAYAGLAGEPEGKAIRVGALK